MAFYAYPPNTTLVDDIVSILGRQSAKNYGVTYQTSSDNKFTLLATPGVWDGSSTVSQPTAACQDLLTQIMDTIASARAFLNITMMWQTWHPARPWVPYGLPLGGFQQAISEGFKRLTASGRCPSVRIMVGVPLFPIVTDDNLKDWLRTTIELDQRQKIGAVGYPILIGCCKQSPESWNHAKIIAADYRAVVGGHNLWESDYLGHNPVHDVSGLIEGSAVACAHNFCAQLWRKPSATPTTWLLRKGQFVHSVPAGLSDVAGAGAPAGTTRMLSLGRLGFGLADSFSMAGNASVSARIMALCRAKASIRISQQSLFFSAAGIGGFDFYTMWALIKAMQAGVNVQIVVSNDTSASDGGYAGDLPIVLNALATLYVLDRLNLNPHAAAIPDRSDISAWAAAAVRPADTKLIPMEVSRVPSEAESTPWLNELNARLRLALLYHAPNINYWQVGNQQKPAANHAKVYIIDDTHFYVGSDNFYLSGETHGLQDTVISSKAAPRRLTSSATTGTSSGRTQVPIPSGRPTTTFLYTRGDGDDHEDSDLFMGSPPHHTRHGAPTCCDVVGVPLSLEPKRTVSSGSAEWVGASWITIQSTLS